MKEESRYQDPPRRNVTTEKENIGGGRAAYRERRDSLDELVEENRGIPGLENHYQSMQSSSRARPVDRSGSRGGGDPFTRPDRGGSCGVDKGSYAEMLRQQIALKQSMTEDEREGRRAGRYASEKTDAYHSRRESSDAGAVVVNSRRRTGNHVGQSSISFA